ncbi:MAG: hypothetical protein ABSA76_08265, partial [Bacteroidales bacterium]
MSSKKSSLISDQISESPGAYQADKYVHKLPAFGESYPSPSVQVSPMSLAERLKRNIIPRRGFCSIAPGATLSEGLTSGNGAMNIEMTCDPYS